MNDYFNEKIQTTLRLPAEEYEQCAKEAYKHGYSINTYLTLLIRQGRLHQRLFRRFAFHNRKSCV